MFRRIEDTMMPDPSFPADLKQLGFFVNETGHIRMIDHPDKPYVYQATNNDRFNEVRCEAMRTCQRREVEVRLSHLGLTRIYLPQFTTAKPNGPSIPILAPVPDTLKECKQIIVLVNDTQQDLGILSYGQLTRDLGINGGSVVNFAKEMIKRSCTNHSAEQDAHISEDGYKLEDGSATPGLIVLNTGQLLYSHNHNQAMTLRSWSAMPRKSIAHDMVRIHDTENHVPGHATAKDHVKTVLDQVILNPARLDASAEIFVVAIENGTEAVLNLLSEDFDKYASRITALSLIHCTLSASQLPKHPRLRSFLLHRTRQWKFNDTTSNPLHCTDVPRDYYSDAHNVETDEESMRCLSAVAPQNQQQQQKEGEGKGEEGDMISFPVSSPINTNKGEGQDYPSNEQVPCPTFAAGTDPLVESIFTNSAVQRAVLDFFEQVSCGGGSGEGQKATTMTTVPVPGTTPQPETTWKPQIQGPKVAFAGTMVDSDLLRAAGF